MLGRGRGEGAADFAVQRALGPEASGLVEEIGHLRRHPAKTSAGADDDCIVIGEVLDLRDRRGLIEFVMRRFCDFRRRQFRHAA